MILSGTETVCFEMIHYYVLRICLILNVYVRVLLKNFFVTDSNFVLGNAQVPQLYPIVYCSDGFCELTGFTRAQIMQKGCACKFLHGPETKDEHKTQIDKALESKNELKLEVIFYKKNGKVKINIILDILQYLSSLITLILNPTVF